VDGLYLRIFNGSFYLPRSGLLEQVTVADLPAEIGIFRSLEEAKKWVGESD
jgi:hypothetical protein